MVNYEETRDMFKNISEKRSAIFISDRRLNELLSLFFDTGNDYDIATLEEVPVDTVLKFEVDSSTLTISDIYDIEEIEDKNLEFEVKSTEKYLCYLASLNYIEDKITYIIEI